MTVTIMISFEYQVYTKELYVTQFSGIIHLLWKGNRQFNRSRSLPQHPAKLSQQVRLISNITQRRFIIFETNSTNTYFKLSLYSDLAGTAEIVPLFPIQAHVKHGSKQEQTSRVIQTLRSWWQRIRGRGGDNGEKNWSKVESTQVHPRSKNYFFFYHVKCRLRDFCRLEPWISISNGSF